jgi:hypothetical protein
MKDNRTLSDYLLDHISEGSRFPKLIGQSERELELSNGVATLIRVLLESKESLSGVGWSELGPRLAALISDLGSDLREQCDWELTGSLLAQIPRFVDRTLELSELIGHRQPTVRTAVYLREATRCYIFGFWQASISLSRAAVENALRERVFEQFGSAPHKFGKLIEFAQNSGILDGARSELANEVKVNGDKVLHGGETLVKDARNALEAARGVLEYLHE